MYIRYDGTDELCLYMLHHLKHVGTSDDSIELLIHTSKHSVIMTMK